MRATYLCLIALVVVPHVGAAPAPATGLKAKEKLEALKKRLPALLSVLTRPKRSSFSQFLITRARR
jgi:hypothetical protein